MKILKKIISLILAFAMCFCLVACGETSSSSSSDANAEKKNTADKKEVQSFAIIPDEYITQKYVGEFEGKVQYDVVLNADCNMDDKEEYIAVLGSEENFITGDTYTVARLKRSQYTGFRELAVKNKHPEEHVFFVNKNLVAVDSSAVGEEKDIAIVSAVFAYLDAVEEGIVTASELNNSQKKPSNDASSSDVNISQGAADNNLSNSEIHVPLIDGNDASSSDVNISQGAADNNLSNPEIHVPLIDGIDKYGNPIKCYEAEQWHVYYKDGIVNQRYPIKPEDVPGVDYNEYNRVFGLQNIKWHDAPKTHDEFLDDFLYAYIRGAWEIDESGLQNFDGVFRYLGVWIQRLGAEWITQCYSALLGDYMNCFQTYAYLGDDNKFYIYTSGDECPVTKDEMMNRLDSVYNEAKNIQNKLNISRGNKTFSSELEKVKAYYDFLIQYYHRNTPDFDKDRTPAEYYQYAPNINSIIVDGANSCIVEHRGACCPHECAFNVFMNNEGIRCYGAGCDGHTVSFVWADGEPYVVDWGNEFGVFPLNDPEGLRWFVPIEDELKITEKRLHITSNKTTETLACWTEQYFCPLLNREEGQILYFDIKYKHANIDGCNTYRVWFSDGQSQVYSEEFTTRNILGGSNQMKIAKKDYESIKANTAYLITRSLSNRIIKGEIAFDEAIAPYVKFQTGDIMWVN